MAVKAKFYVSQVTHYAAGEQISVALQPVSRGEENKDWAKYTPSGRIEMNILNPTAAEQFKPGTEFYVTFLAATEE